MRLFTTVAALRCYLSLERLEHSHINETETGCAIASLSQRTVGLVPTMGSLHQGHLSLLQRARQENDIAIATIFVNPLQFGPTEDYQRYPRQLDLDRQLCEQAGVDVIFAPTAEELGIGEQGDKEDLGDKGGNYELRIRNYELLKWCVTAKPNTPYILKH